MADKYATMTRQQKIAELERKRELLSECNENIARLQVQLSEAKVRKALKDQKEAAAKAPHSNKGLPDAILLPIFRYYVRENSMGIRRLVTICKGWKDYIEDAEELWSVVWIKIPSKAKDIPSCVKFCEETTRRSGDLPLDVYIDYTTSALPFDRVLFEHLLEPLQKVNDDPEYLEMLDGWLWRRCRTQNAEFWGKYQEHFMKPLVALVGDGEPMSRWRSFEIHSRQDTRNLFHLGLIGPILQHPTPILQSIKIVSTGKYPTVWGKQTSTAGEKIFVHPFTSLPSLEHLSLAYCHLPIDFFDIKPKNMKTLELPWYSEATTLAQVLQCTNVTSLVVTADHKLKEEELKNGVELGPGSHEFSYLKTMKMGGKMVPRFWSACTFPVLEDLTFVDGRAPPSLIGDEQFTLPQLQSITFLGPPVNKAESVSFTDVFKKIVLSCPGLHTINALDKYADQILQSLKDLKASGVTSSSLTTLSLKTKRQGEAPSRTVDLEPIIGR